MGSSLLGSAAPSAALEFRVGAGLLPTLVCFNIIVSLIWSAAPQALSHEYRESAGRPLTLHVECRPPPGRSLYDRLLGAALPYSHVLEFLLCRLPLSIGWDFR